MTASIDHEDWKEQQDDPEVRIDGRVDPRREDAYWQGAYWSEAYCRADCCYDDYAPAYCVGYIGYAQYGGRFDDAEKSLCANWVRIKGDSRLTYDEALLAIRAAWDRAERAQLQSDDEEELVDAGFAAAQSRTSQPAYATA